MAIDWIPVSSSKPEDGLRVLMFSEFWGEDKFEQVQEGFMDAGLWFYEAGICDKCQPQPSHWAHWPSGPTQTSEPVTQTNAIAPRTGA